MQRRELDIFLRESISGLRETCCQGALGSKGFGMEAGASALFYAMKPESAVFPCLKCIL